MDKLFNFCEKLTKNQRNNGRMIISFAVFSIISMISAIFLLVTGAEGAVFMFSLAVFGLSIALFWAVFDRMRYFKDALDESNRYIEKLENENKDYKMNTDVLLNDPEIKRIMQGRIARMPKP